MELLHSSTQKLAIIVTIAIIIFTITPFLYPFRANPNFFLKQPPTPITSHLSKPTFLTEAVTDEYCDIFSGKWVPDANAPYYTNTTCWAIHEHQNCMKFGRPDSGFMQWKWKPDGCEMPVFNPFQFLEIMRGKTMAFIGDSVSRNHMQSLICLLSRVEYPVDVSENSDEYFKRWKYETYNFTIAAFWTPHLIRSTEHDPTRPDHSDLLYLHLDEADPKWTSEIGDFDYVIISSGHWHYRPSIFFQDGTIIGCHYCQLPNITDLTMFYGYRRAFRTALRAILNSESFKGVMYLRSFAPSHFEGGLWNQGGNCLRKQPYGNNEAGLDERSMELYMIQMEEFQAAEKEARKKGMRFRVIDTTQAMWMRPDGHPSRYGHLPGANVSLYNDCVHWCLPGPIDTLNDFLLAMIKREGRGFLSNSKTRSTDRKMLS